jgi:hypothetical protein
MIRLRPVRRLVLVLARSWSMFLRQVAVLRGQVSRQLLEHLAFLGCRVLEYLLGLLAQSLRVLKVLLALFGVLGELLELLGQPFEALRAHLGLGALGRLLGLPRLLLVRLLLRRAALEPLWNLLLSRLRGRG